MLSQKNQLKKHPEIEKQLNIEKTDERNLMIGYLAKSKSNDFASYLFATLLIVLALIRVDLVAALLLAFAYLAVQAYAFYYRFKYNKEM